MTKKIIKSIFIYLFGILYLIPVIWIISLSLRSKKDTFLAKLFTTDIHFENYVKAWIKMDFGKLFINSLIVTFFSVLITLIIASLAAYAFSKIKYRGSDIIFYAILLGIMIPQAAIIIPLFIIMKNIGLYNNLIALILSYTVFGLPIAIFILRGFFISIPDELIEAARIDGSSEIGTFVKIVLPISRPAIYTIIIFLVMINWNEFLLALVLLRDKLTVPVGIGSQVGLFDIEWNLIAAGVIISALPIFITYLVLQDLFVKGLTAGAVKG